MITIERDEFKKTKEFNLIFQTVKRAHQVPAHTEKILRENAHIEGFTEVSKHFADIGIKPKLYISYVTNSQIEGNHVYVRFESITFYDNEIEFMLEKAKALHSDKVGNFVERN